MKIPPTPLTFGAVDGLGFAASAGRLKNATQNTRYLPTSLGPLLELLNLIAGGRLPSPCGDGLLAENGAGSMITALRRKCATWVKPEDRSMGFILATGGVKDGDTLLTKFLMDAQRAARAVTGLPGSTPGQLVAAMEELENNIHEHSDAPKTGILAFRATRDAFEFVVADRGIGILRSLRRCSAFAMLQDYGKAMEAALADGTSRYGSDSRRGHGFRPIFLGLANLRGSLRFRSGDHALLIDGVSPDLTTAQLAQKPFIDGFVASVTCHVGSADGRRSAESGFLSG
jgi:hypothetical protein